MGNFKNVPKVINGDTVIGFTSTRKVKDLGWSDLATVYSWYQDDPNKNHLGLVELFTNAADVKLPSYKEFFKKGAVIEVNGVNGTFTYDLPVYKKNGTFTIEDTSTYSDAPGIDGSVFPLVLDKPYQPGDILTYDLQYGDQVVVSEDYTVEQTGDGYKHWVKFVTNDSYSFYPADKLKAGVQYFKVSNILGEFSEQFSSIESPDTVGTIKCEFSLGGHRGVETFYTMYADKKNVSGASVNAKTFWNKFVSKMEAMGTDEMGRPLEMFYMAKLNRNGKIAKNTLRIGATLEYLILLELMKMESHSLLFQKGGFINDINGTKYLSEGIWHQFRRGTIIKYSRPGGITKNHLRAAVSVLFQNRKDLDSTQRRVKFKAGKMAYLNLKNLFNEEANAQLQAAAYLLGAERLTPKSPISGKDNLNMVLEPLQFKSVNFPEIGWIEIEYDPSLDYSLGSDRHSSGFMGDGLAWTSYSLIIYDASDPQYSNARTDLPNNVKLVDGGDKSANVFYVKPEGESMYWGYTQGRYAPDKAGEIFSSIKKMGREAWAHNISAGWVKDISRVVMIELKR